MNGQQLSVTLPTSTAYVSGTVNGTACVWTNTEGDTWETTAERAADDIYHISLTVIEGAGTHYETSLTLYYGVLNLITDRTQADVRRVQQLASKGWDGMTEAERAEWQSGLKGAYNAGDMNRVGAAVAYVAGRFQTFGYDVTVNPKQDWKLGEIPTIPQLDAYLKDVRTLRGVLDVLASTPAAPDDMDGLTWQEANNIERILLDVDMLLTHASAAWIYSGEQYTGEE